jgi:hypothetical protein
MTPSALPDRPNLEQLKKQAKSLLHAAQARDPAALQRFTVLPAFAHKSAAELSALGFALHDAQSVIAREYGFASWNAMRDEVEARTLSFDAAVDEFIRSATGGASGRAARTSRRVAGTCRWLTCSCSTVPIPCAADLMAARRTPSRSFTAITILQRGSSRMVRRASCRHSNSSLPPALAPIARPQTQCWTLDRACVLSCAPSTTS